tara:strand:+ start:3020 stop:3358 length:339 start_codon:yes stop_codon:yes gene_type:complete
MNKDVMRIIINKLEEEDFLSFMEAQPELFDDTMFIQRVEKYFPTALKIKDETITWKEYCLGLMEVDRKIDTFFQRAGVSKGVFIDHLNKTKVISNEDCLKIITEMINSISKK